MNHYYIYILANKPYGTLYVGITNNIFRRAWEHKNDIAPGFTQKYKVHMLVYFEEHNDALSAITREKNIKKWKREWKLKLINSHNPGWKDLYKSIIN